jgi:hypothetical protein
LSRRGRTHEADPYGDEAEEPTHTRRVLVAARRERR